MGQTAASADGCTPGCTTPAAAAPDLLKLLAELARLPADQRQMLMSLMGGVPAAVPAAATPLDDRLPPGFESIGGARQ